MNQLVNFILIVQDVLIFKAVVLWPEVEKASQYKKKGRNYGPGYSKKEEVKSIG